MRIAWAVRAACAASLTLGCGAALACAFPTYNLPIPFRLYAIGATSALAFSFLLVGFLVRSHGTASAGERLFELRSVSLDGSGALERGLGVLRLLSVGGLLLTIATGIFGSQIAIENFNITFFFVVFVLGFAYLTAFVGDVYALVNPWRCICDWIDRRLPGTFRGRYAYPRRLGYYPALVLYMGYIWIELFANIAPLALSRLLIAYCVLNLLGAWLVGKAAWFEHGEFLSVFFRLIGKMAPIRYVPIGPHGGIRVESRAPFVGLIAEPAADTSLLLFVLFMLSSTAVDGAHETLPWVGLFWKGIYPWLSPIGAGMAHPMLFSVQAYYGWQWLMLFASPLVYLGIFVAFIAATRLLSGSDRSLHSLVLQFAFTLIPIAFVYNVTHYFTLLLGQGSQIGRMIADPFNRGWNLFGSATWGTQPLIPDASVVWHVQVGLILAGHIVSVYLAHAEALKIFASSRKAVLSQLPMLVLMMIFTTAGLWILSLPISAGQVTDTAAVSTTAPGR